MPNTEMSNLTTSQMKTGVPDFQVQAKTLDVAGVQPETYWTNPYWTTYLGYLKTIPEYRNAVRSLAIWTCGKGWDGDSLIKTILGQIRGWGEDTFDSIMQDMIIVKKTNGDAFAEIVREGRNETIINLKKLDPSSVRIAVNPKGIIIGYDVMQANGKYQRFKPQDIFHISNDRIANEIHGTSVLESCKNVIDWKNEVMADLRRLMHRSSIRVMYIDMDNKSKLNDVRTQYKEAIKNGEVLLLPGKKGVDFEVVDYPIPPTQAYLEVLRFLDNYFYEVLGVPKIVTGGTQNYSEASSKVGYMTFEQPYMTEQRLLEQDIWNQLGIKITFERPVSLKDSMQSSEAANTGQVGFQPNELNPTMTRNE